MFTQEQQDKLNALVAALREVTDTEAAMLVMIHRDATVEVIGRMPRKCLEHLRGLFELLAKSAPQVEATPAPHPASN